MKKLLMFAVPIVIGNVLQQLYTTVDTLVIGRFSDTQSLAAIGTSAQPIEVFLCLFIGMGTGVSILVSQTTGAGDARSLRDICRTTVSFVYACGIPLMILAYITAPALLSAMGVPPDAMSSATLYTRVVMWGSLGNVGYNMNAGILRGLGDSRSTLKFLALSCGVNIVLDLILVAGFGMGVMGAAVATSVSVYISWFFSIAYIKSRFGDIGFTILPAGYDLLQLKRMLYLGLPIGFNNSLYSFGHVVMQSMVNAQGANFMAGVALGSRIMGVGNIAVNSLSSSTTTFAGQNYGAGRYDRLKMGYIKIPVISGLLTLAPGLLVILVKTPLLSAFTSDAGALVYAERYVTVLALSQWIFAVFNGIICFANGIGEVKYPTVVNILMLWAVRLPAAYLISRLFDGTYIMLSFPISFTFGLVAMTGFYLFNRRWKSIGDRLSPV